MSLFNDNDNSESTENRKKILLGSTNCSELEFIARVVGFSKKDQST